MWRLAILGAYATLAACSSAPQPADRAGQPQRIVSLNPCADAILAEIAPDRLVAVSHYSHDPRASSMEVAKARRWPATGGTVEEVLALDPDLVVASTFLEPATAKALADLNIPVEMVGIASTPDESAEQVRALATATAADAAKLLDRMPVTQRNPGPDAPRVLVWQEGGIVAGPNSMVAAMLERAGLANHAAARGLGQGAYLPLEQVLADPPDIVLAAGDDRALVHPALRRLPGVTYARLDPALLYCGGPTIPKLAARLEAVRGEAR